MKERVVESRTIIIIAIFARDAKVVAQVELSNVSPHWLTGSSSMLPV